MKKNLATAVLMTIATTVLLGIIYPLMVTALAQVLFPKKANGQLIEVNVGSLARALSDRLSPVRIISTPVLPRQGLAMTLPTPTDRSGDLQITN
jgi:hypothetical protein